MTVPAAPAVANEEKRRLWAGILLCAIALKLLLLIAYTADARWVMDEYTTGYTAHLLDEGAYRSVDPIKSMLPEFLFHAGTHGEIRSVTVQRLWRIESLAGAFGLIAVTMTIAGRLHGGLQPALFAAFVLLSFTNFMEHSFRVRNDSFAIFFAAASFACLVKKQSPLFFAWASGALMGLAFLCTQKTAYHAIAVGAGLIALHFERSRWRSAVSAILQFAIGFAVPLLLYAFYFRGFGFASVILDLFLSPARHSAMLSGYSGGLERYLLQTLERNLVAYVVCVAGAIVAATHWSSLERQQRAVLVASTIVAVLIFRHAQSWPYVFVMAIPFLSLWAWKAIQAVPHRLRRLVEALTVTLLALSYVRNVHYLRDSSPDQVALVDQAESMLRPDERYFDGIGMIPTRRIAGRYPWWYWDRPTLSRLADRWAAGEREELASILRDEPKIWIWNYRLQALAPLLEPILVPATVRISEFLLVAGSPIEPSARSFRNLWSGEFQVFDVSGKPSAVVPIVDGVPCPLPCRIEAGTREIRVDSTAGFLLPADFRLSTTLPYSGPFQDLFLGIYDF